MKAGRAHARSQQAESQVLQKEQLGRVWGDKDKLLLWGFCLTDCPWFRAGDKQCKLTFILLELLFPIFLDRAEKVWLLSSKSCQLPWMEVLVQAGVSIY